MPSWTRRLWLGFLALVGCTPTVYTHGIPNLAQVDQGLNVWRGGQPTTADGWAYLKSLGIKRVVKLNFASEGTDDGAVALGLEVHTISIQPEGDKDIWDNVLDTFVKPDPKLIVQALDIMDLGDTFVHCTHGQDRTGAGVVEWRKHRQHWTMGEAWREALDHGFHPELEGLTAFLFDDDGVQ